MASEFFGRQRECRFYTAGCGNKMAVSVTGPRAVNELGGPVIPGRQHREDLSIFVTRMCRPHQANLTFFVQEYGIT